MSVNARPDLPSAVTDNEYREFRALLEAEPVAVRRKAPIPPAPPVAAQNAVRLIASAAAGVAETDRGQLRNNPSSDAPTAPQAGRGVLAGGRRERCFRRKSGQAEGVHVTSPIDCLG